MSETADKTPFKELHSEILSKGYDPENGFDRSILGIEDEVEHAEAMELLRRLTGYYMPDYATNTYTTFPRFLSVAKRIAEVTCVEVPVSSNAFITRSGTVINADSDIETIWLDALQDDQTSYYWALQNYKEHEDDRDWAWTKDYADSILEALDRNYDLSNNMEACFPPSVTETT